MTLNELVQMVLDVKLKDADPDDMLTYLHMADCAFDNDAKPLDKPGQVIVALDVGPGPAIAAMARLMIARCEPTSVVMALPSWSAKLPPGQTLKTYGVTAVKDLPPDLVQDTLIVIGQDEGGTSLMHGYVIERNERGDRVWVKQASPDGWSSRFDRLFVLPEMLKTAMPFASGFGLSPEKARYHAKQAALRLLADQAQRVMERTEA